jgi:hypothetical protein
MSQANKDHLIGLLSEHIANIADIINDESTFVIKNYNDEVKNILYHLEHGSYTLGTQGIKNTTLDDLIEKLKALKVNSIVSVYIIHPINWQLIKRPSYQIILDKDSNQLIGYTDL